MIYLDANFLVFCFFDQSQKGENSRLLLQQIVKGKEAVTSALALDEAMWAVVKSGRKAELRQFVEGIYAIPNLEIKEVNSEIPLLALNFIEGFGLKPRDAFHAAVMESFAITEIVSDDSDFDRAKGIKRIKL